MQNIQIFWIFCKVRWCRFVNLAEGPPSRPAQRHFHVLDQINHLAIRLYLTGGIADGRDDPDPGDDNAAHGDHLGLALACLRQAGEGDMVVGSSESVRFLFGRDSVNKLGLLPVGHGMASKHQAYSDKIPAKEPRRGNAQHDQGT